MGAFFGVLGSAHAQAPAYGQAPAPAYQAPGPGARPHVPGLSAPAYGPAPAPAYGQAAPAQRQPMAKPQRRPMARPWLRFLAWQRRHRRHRR
jgi:hypothetical protein